MIVFSRERVINRPRRVKASALHYPLYLTRTDVLRVTESFSTTNEAEVNEYSKDFRSAVERNGTHSKEIAERPNACPEKPETGRHCPSQRRGTGVISSQGPSPSRIPRTRPL